MKEGSKMTEAKQKSTSRGRKTMKKEVEVKPDPNQLDLLTNQTVAEMEQQAEPVEIGEAKPDKKVKEEPKKGAKRGRKAANEQVELVADNRQVIKAELKDITMEEVRETVKRFKRGSKQHSFTLDLRNLQVLNQLADENGLDKSTVLDLAINRFIQTDVKQFPFWALTEVELDKRVTFVVSETAKNELTLYAKNTRQNAQHIVNLALQSLRDEMRSERR